MASLSIQVLFCIAVALGGCAQSISKNIQESGKLNSCYFLNGKQHCFDSSGNEGVIEPSPNKFEASTSYDSCRSDESGIFCTSEDEKRVQFIMKSQYNEKRHGEGESGSKHCHTHGDEEHCVDESESHGHDEKESGSGSKHCHTHGDEEHCVDDESESHAHDEEESESGSQHCHFHAGVEHCVDGGSESSKDQVCEKVDRDYNIPLRIGLLFVVLVTSALGSFGPLLLNKVFKIDSENIIFVICKQFGCGVIISTAFVHLLTHAGLMWSNNCMHGLDYEATGSAITMAGIFISFLIDFLSHYFRNKRNDNQELVQVSNETNTSLPDKEEYIGSEVSINSTEKENENLNVYLLAAGIILHSILIGITLVVAGNSFFITLFIVIVFHQFFEGVALGSKIVDLHNVGMLIKLGMAGLYSLITPIGMAIGIGVIHKFNGNDKSTLIALGTLDSLSAGVLIYTGLVNMLAAEWIRGKLSNAKPLRVVLAMLSFIAGMILMSVLGKWA